MAEQEWEITKLPGGGEIISKPLDPEIHQKEWQEVGKYEKASEDKPSKPS